MGKVLLVALLLSISLSFVSNAQDNNPASTGLGIHVVQRDENLFRIALRYGLTTEQLAQLNGITNPETIYVGQRLLVPTGTLTDTEAALTHTVAAGESLQSIAIQYNTTISELISWNNLSNPDTLYIGQTLLVSPPDEGLTTIPEPNEANTSLLHTVQHGETLFRIAMQYGVTVHDLAQANGLSDPTLIFAGQQLLIPGFSPPPISQDLPPPLLALDVKPVVFIEGETSRISITTETPNIFISGTFLGRNLHIISEPQSQQHIAFISIPIDTQAGIYPVSLQIHTPNGAQIDYSFNVQILSGNYGVQSITLPDDKLELLTPAVEENELSILANITAPITPERYITTPLSLPAAATMNAFFGARRSYNGGAPDRYHSGVDFAGAPGTPILASASGRVVLVDTLNIRGRTTVIDHGWGIYTAYAHQAEQYVQLGDIVSTGQIIGTIGATGRATGAHLHWEVWVNGVPVNPLQWVQQTFP